MNPDLLEDSPGNTLEISWDEDTILSYKYPGVFALKRPTWVVNPTRKIDDFRLAFFTDMGDAMQRFACVPTYSSDAFFKQVEKVRNCMTLRNPIDNFKRFDEAFKPDPEKVYYVHADLAQKHDKCAVAIAHVDKWVTMKMAGAYSDAAPNVIVDAVRWWTPTKEKSVDFTEVKNYIISLKQRGFNIKRVTFDRWNSFDMMEQLKSYGMNCEILSVAKKHYEDMVLTVMEERISGPRLPLLIDELLELRIVKKDKVDHPRKGSKDLADATCGAIYNAIALTPKGDGEIHVYSYEMEGLDEVEAGKNREDGVIRVPDKKQIPGNLRDYLGLDDEIEPEHQFVDNFTIL